MKSTSSMRGQRFAQSGRSHGAGLLLLQNSRAHARKAAPVVQCRSAVLEQQHETSSLPEQPAQHGGAVVSHLVGKNVLQINSHLSTVPLLHPLAHSLPFAASLQVYTNSSSAEPGRSIAAGSSSHSNSSSSSGSLVELHYVISGSGYFSNSTTGVQQALLPGDSIISLHGAAQFAAGPAAGRVGSTQQQDSTQQQQQQQHTSNAALSQLLGWLQQLHHNKPAASSDHNSKQEQEQPLAAHVTAADMAGTADQLVMLQLLLPSELLTGQLLTHHAGHCHAVAQQLPWSISSLQSQAAGFSVHGATAAGRHLQEQEVCALLGSGSFGTEAHVQPEHQHHHHDHLQQQPQDPASVNQNASSAAVSSSAPAMSTNSGATTTSTNTSSGSKCVLPSLQQQQTLKRALSEVGAFRLPQQTNRLALLFGPHSSPAVSLSFGVEVFEPGHTTALHIHSTAHELFFVLAGKGEAVFRRKGTDSHNTSSGSGGGGGSSNGTQRVMMSPGDVAVFAPGVVHGVDNPSSSDQLYCLQMMLPNEAFVEWVHSGEAAGALDLSALRLAAAASCG